MPSTQAKKDAKTPVKKYQPTDLEQQFVELNDKRIGQLPETRFKVADDGTIGADHADPQTALRVLMEQFGTGDPDFLGQVLNHIGNISGKDAQNAIGDINFAVSVIKGIKPRDEVEAMLGAQMAAIHMQVMTFARRLNGVETIPQQDSAEKAFNKLTRTFAAQMEALRKYRTGGEQKVTVQHVHVNEGGQAVVGSISRNSEGGGGGKES